MMGLVAQVLLIEDDPAIRRSLGMALGRHGHQVCAAETGEEGLRQSREARPEIVVLDLMLPGIDGFEVCRRLRADSNVPIIMLTARNDDFDVVGGLEAARTTTWSNPCSPGFSTRGSGRCCVAAPQSCSASIGTRGSRSTGTGRA
jgi:two-component system, OmpR family, response regulator MtrA